jgi:hypothetical protein
MIQFADLGTDNIRSDGGGVYQDGVNGVGAVINVGSNGALGLGMGTGPRRLNLFFGSCLLAAPDVCNYPFLSGNVAANVIAAPRDAAGTSIASGLLGMPLNVVMNMFVQVWWDGGEWTLCMKPEGEGACSLSDAPYARIVRVRADAWEVFASTAPDALGARSDVADLIRKTGVGKKKTVSVEGTFSMPFRFTVTCVIAANCS